MRSAFLSTVFLACLQSTHGQTETQYDCQDITFRVTASAENVLAQNPPVDFTNATEVVVFLSQTTTPYPVNEKTFSIYAQYCQPSNPTISPPKPLQILIPGNTYDHTFNNGFDRYPVPGNANSWASLVLSRGYSTLSVDRLGSGKSDHPDPLNIVQVPLVADTIHQIIRQIRDGRQATVPSLGQRKIIYVGHSFGSIVGTKLSAEYPEDIDAIILTGFAIPTPEQQALPGQLPNVYLQASTYDPVRFPSDVFVPGYLVATSKEGRRNTLYSAPEHFSAAIYDKDFEFRDTVTLGEVITQQPLALSSNYDNPTFVLTGRQDSVFCGMGSRELGIPDCGSGRASQLAAVKALYPAVPDSKFATYTQERAGHSNQMHYTAQEGFENVYRFLVVQGLA